MGTMRVADESDDPASDCFGLRPARRRQNRDEGSLYHPDAAAGERYVVRVRVFANYQQSAAGAAPALARG